MNAYELADNFDTLGRLNDWAQQTQNMLRQQADRIAELEKNELKICQLSLDRFNQQADRIAELEQNKARMSMKLSIVNNMLDGEELDPIDMEYYDSLHEKLQAKLKPQKNAEPVAWMLTLPDGTHDWILDGRDCEGYIPLYTTPQTKPTTTLMESKAKIFWDEVNKTPQTKPRLSDEEILGAVARGWCSEKNSMKTMDSDLAMAIADEVKRVIEERILGK